MSGGTMVLAGVAVAALAAAVFVLQAVLRRRRAAEENTAAAAASIAAAYALDALSSDPRDPGRRAAALAAYTTVPGPGPDPVAGPVLALCDGYRRASQPRVLDVRGSGGRWWVSVEVTETTYRQSDQRAGGGRAAARVRAAEDELDPEWLHGTVSAVPPPTAPGWQVWQQHPVRLVVPVRATPERLAIDPLDRQGGPSGPPRSRIASVLRGWFESRWFEPRWQAVYGVAPALAHAVAATHIRELIAGDEGAGDGFVAEAVLPGTITAGRRGPVVVDTRALVREPTGWSSWLRFGVPMQIDAGRPVVVDAGVVRYTTTAGASVSSSGGQPGPLPRRPGAGARRLGRPHLVAAAVTVLVLVGVSVMAAGTGVVAGVVQAPDGGPHGAAAPHAAPGPAAPPAAEPPQLRLPRPPVGVAVAIPTLDPPIPVPDRPGFVGVAPDGAVGLVTSPDTAVIQVLDMVTGEVSGTIALPAAAARYVAFSPDGAQAYASLSDDRGDRVHEIVVIDMATRAVASRISVGQRPGMPAVSGDGRRLWVPSHGESRLDVIDTAAGAVVETIPVAANPHWVELSPDQTRLLVANHESNVVSIVDAKTGQVLQQSPAGPSPHSTAIDPTGELGVATNYDGASVTVLDMAPGAVRATVPVPAGPQDVAVSPDGRMAYVVCSTARQVAVLDLATLRVTATIPTAPVPTGIAVNPTGDRAWVTDLDSRQLTVLRLTA